MSLVKFKIPAQFKPTTPQALPQPGLYAFEITKAESSQKDSTSPYIEFQLFEFDKNGKPKGKALGVLRKIFQLDSRSIKSKHADNIAQRNLDEVCSLAVYAGFQPDEEVVIDKLVGLRGFIGVENRTVSGNNGDYLIADSGARAFWPADTDPASIEWKPRTGAQASDGDDEVDYEASYGKGGKSVRDEARAHFSRNR